MTASIEPLLHTIEQNDPSSLSKLLATNLPDHAVWSAKKIGVCLEEAVKLAAPDCVELLIEQSDVNGVTCALRRALDLGRFQCLKLLAPHAPSKIINRLEQKAIEDYKVNALQILTPFSTHPIAQFAVETAVGHLLSGNNARYLAVLMAHPSIAPQLPACIEKQKNSRSYGWLIQTYQQLVAHQSKTSLQKYVGKHQAPLAPPRKI